MATSAGVGGCRAEREEADDAIKAVHAGKCLLHL